MTTFQENFGKYLLELLGRNRSATTYTFPDNEIVTPAVPVQVSDLWNAIYLNLHPTLYAVAIAPDGRILHLKGGYNYPLEAGRYILHFIDKQNRISLVPGISEATTDGSQVSLEIIITYRVIDPVKALEVQHSVNTLFVFIQSDLKEFIRSHMYDEIVEENSRRIIDNNLVARYIKEKHSRRHQISKLFFIADIIIKEKQVSHQLPARTRSLQPQESKNIHNAVVVEDYVTARVPRKDKPKIFISYSGNDFRVASEIYNYLLDHECSPWMDKYDLIPGQDWKLEIQKSIKDSDFFIACLSNYSVSKVGFIQKELKEALSVLDEMPVGQIYLIPIRIDDCIVPDSLAGKHWLDWSSLKAKELLLRAIESKYH